jgi:hypothetical protein
MPFFRSIVVMVAVVTFSSVAMTAGERLKDASGGMVRSCAETICEGTAAD